MKPASTQLERVTAELKALQCEYGAAQKRCSETLAALHRRNQQLEAELIRLRGRLMARETALRWSREELRRLAIWGHGMQEAPQAGRVAGRFEALALRLEALTGRMQTLLRLLWTPGRAGGHDAEAVQESMYATDAADQLVQPEPAPAVAPGATDPAEIQAAGLAESMGSGQNHAQDGLATDAEDIPDLEKRLDEADLVICQTGCLSHQAYWRMQDHCRRHNKPCVLVAQPDALRIIRIHNHRDSGDSVRAVEPAPGRLDSHRRPAGLAQDKDVETDATTDLATEADERPG